MKDDNENYQKKIMKLEELNYNNDFTQIKKLKEKIESLTEEQKTKINN